MDRQDPIGAFKPARPDPGDNPGKGRVRRIFWRVFWLAIAAGIIGAVAWWIDQRPAPPTRSGRIGAGAPMPVVPVAAQKGDIAVLLNALGTVTPLASVTVKTQINGQLIRVAYTEGQFVTKGALLAEIDPRPYLIALEQAQSVLQKDQALLANAELDLERYRKLAAEDAIPKQQLDTQEALVRQYRAAIKTDRAQIDAVELNLAYCKIVAPISGRVGLRLVDEGNYVQVNDNAGLAIITQTKPISVIFTLPQDHLPGVLARLRAGAQLPVAAFDRGQTTRLAEGVLATVDNQIDTATGTIKLRAVFENADERLFANQFVNIQLRVDTLKDQVILPMAAILRGAVGAFVYVIKPDETVTVRAV
ncbi:MAG: efflux RND transporter periplasmic adaptor subunit, partial [Alphaproteobacteria bacterium]|nr:efflux RND transporter periplasmic adaptor subunit [Alphaproteobacteria bacterium]